MLEEICIRRRAGRKFEQDSVLNSRWTILSSLSNYGGGISDGCFNRGIKIVQEKGTGRLCVLKMLQPEICSPGHAVRELRILGRMVRYSGGGHANILRALDSDDGSKHPHDIPWVVTELCDRGTLTRFITMYREEGLPLPDAFVWHVFESLAESARFLHSHGVVHRDITLSNVFLQSSSRKDAYPKVQLGDFGCAVTREDLAQLSHENPLPGSPGFMPPEGHKPHPTCDIYQIGLVVLCLHMCDVDPTESLADFFEPDGLRRQGSRELGNLIGWCLAAIAEERPNAEILLGRIRKLKAEAQETKG